MSNANLNAIKRAASTTRQLDDGSAEPLRRVVEEVTRFHKEEGYAPSFTDLSKALGWTLVTTRTEVRALIETGHLTLKAGVARSLRITSETERLAARAQAWYVALRDLPAFEVAAARAALDKLSPGSTGAA